MLSYCVKQRKRTACVPGSEQYVKTKNGRNAMKCQCAECGITKFRFLSKGEIQGSGFDELIVKGLASGAKGLFNLGKKGASEAIKSDAAKKKFKEIGQKYLDQVIDSVTDDVSKRIAGKGVDIHKAIGKLPKPKSGWTLPGHKYTGPYNDLENQVRYDNQGNILEIYDMPTGKTDAIAMQHDVDYSICKDDKKCKHRADKRMVRALDAVAWKERQWGHWLARNTINTKRKLGLGVASGKVKKNAQNLTWEEKLADELHKPIRRNFPKRRVIVHNVDDIWCSDLVDMQKLSKWNKGYKYLLMVLDLFSKYGWIVPLKTKTGLEVSKAFESIFKKAKGKAKPTKLWVDKRKEYYNKNVLYLLAKNNIEIYSTENEEKSSVCERWNRTIKEKMYKRFTMQNNTVYIDILPKNTRFL